MTLWKWAPDSTHRAEHSWQGTVQTRRYSFRATSPRREIPVGCQYID